jgi:hypothetical protein
MMPVGKGELMITGSTALETETVRAHDVRGFSFVKLCGRGTVELVQGEREAVEVEAPDNLHEATRVCVEGETLSIDLESRGIGVLDNTELPIRFRVYVRTIYGLESSGSVRIHGSRIETGDLRVMCSGASRAQLDVIRATDLSVHLSGAGKMNLGTVNSDHVDIDLDGAGKVRICALTADRFQACIGGAGEIEASGTADQQDLTISGAGSMLLGSLCSCAARVSISGIGKASVHASDALEANVSGMGTVEYDGNPRVLSGVTSGIGTVVRR